MCNNPNLDFADINALCKIWSNSINSFSICWAEMKFWLESRNTKGHHYITNWWKYTRNNLNLDLGDINAYAKFGQILPIHSQDIELKRKVLWTEWLTTSKQYCPHTS